MEKRAPRSPTRFVVARHLLSHPEDGSSQLAQHTGLPASGASRALRRIVEETGLLEASLLEIMRSAPEKPRWRSFPFRAPNPAQWSQAMKAPHWLSGEQAADAVDDLDVASDRRIEYVRGGDLDEAFHAAKRIHAKACPPRQANLVIRVADPWMDLSGDVAERGQRWYDYATSHNLQLAAWRP